MANHVKNLILERIEQRGSVTSAEIQDETGLTRQGVNLHLRGLREEGRIRKIGKTRGVRYVLADAKHHPGHALDRWLSSAGLMEDEVFRQVSLEANLETALTRPAYEILQYAFTEILNNAIEHSGSPRIRIRVEIGPYDASFLVKDSGVGIYRHIQESLGLASEVEALQDLLKGKTTTAPEGHSGEGVFFTSRCADFLRIASHRMAVLFDNRKDRVVTERIRETKGTLVEFSILRRSRRKLALVFDRFGGEEFDYRFSKTSVRVSLSGSAAGRPTSRSEARRLLFGLNRFRIVELDFREVDAIGQAFADEVFRVFAGRNPEIRIRAFGANAAVQAMLDHVRPA